MPSGLGCLKSALSSVTTLSSLTPPGGSPSGSVQQCSGPTGIPLRQSSDGSGERVEREPDHGGGPPGTTCGSHPHLSLAPHDPLDRGQLAQPHRPSDVELLCRDADLG